MGETGSMVRRAPQAVQVDEDGLGPLTSALGEEIRAQRAFLGLTQRALAEAARVARQTLLDLEAGRRLPGVQLLVRIALALELELTDLITMATDRMEAAADAARELLAPITHRSVTDPHLA